jgi:TonB-dependent starch-binding outer membrane protein SusC
MKKVLLLLSMVVLQAIVVFAQTTSVTGKVTDNTGEPVQFASVKVKGTNTGVSADVAGNFKIQARLGDVLQVSGVGISTTEISVTSLTAPISITVTRATGNIEGVVVTGYATRSKRSSTGAFAAVDVADVRTQPIASFDQLLQGQAPGINVRAGSGQPGAAALVQIRGVGTLVGSTTPLYIVDGIQITAQDFTTLNQADFESLSILKDASAAALYGSRGANGVIVITTRKGRAGAVRINYDAQYGRSYFPRSKNILMNTNEKLDYELANGNPNNWNTAEVDSLRKINTDWEDVFFQTGITNSHQLSLSGGTERTRFYTSLGLFDQSGVVKTTALKRYTGRFNIENNLNNWKINLNSTFGFSKFTNTDEGDEVVTSPLNSIRWTLPYFTPYDKDGNYLQDPTPTAQPNALQELLENSQYRNQVKALANLAIEYRFPFIKGVTFRTNWGIDYMQNEANVYLAPNTAKGASTEGSKGGISNGFSSTFRYMGTNSLTYRTTLGAGNEHDLTVSAYSEIIQANFRSFGYTGYGLILPFSNEAAITQGTSTNGYIANVNGNALQTEGLVSYFADVNYGFKNRYFINASFRRDGSDKFGTNNKWGNFGSAGISWLVSDEAFFANMRSINLLKFRASYGSLGNQLGIGSFAPLALYGRTSYSGTPGLTLIQPGNPDIKWETKTTLNAGVDFGVFKNRLTGSVDVFRSITTNLFFNEQLPGTSGFTTVQGNLGKLRNGGVEVQLRGELIKSKNFSWIVDGNYTYVKNKILELNAGQDQTSRDVRRVFKVGYPTSTFFLVKYAGVDPATGDALYYGKAGKITHVYNPDDRVLLGTSDAPNYGGITNTFNYKGVELSVFWVYSIGNELYNGDRVNVENPSYIASQLSINLLREWRNPGDQTDIPRADQALEQSTTRFLENGGYWRLRNVMLSYNIPARWLQRAKISNIRVFVQGQNLATITKFKGFDPEVPASSLTGAQYPSLKTYTFGLNVGF